MVAIHGLNGDAIKTVTTADGKHFWLGYDEMLPKDVPNSRILTYSYPARVATILGSTSLDRMLQLA